MKYVQCPRCRARFHTGVIYESVETCARCGSRLASEQRLIGQLRAVLARRVIRESLDWEAITESQYVPTRVTVRRARHDGKNAAAA